MILSFDVTDSETEGSEAGVDPGEHGLQPQETAPDGGDGLKGKRSGIEKGRMGRF